MMATLDETPVPLDSALVRARRTGRNRGTAVSNGTGSGFVIPLIARRAFLTSLTGGLLAAPLAAEAQRVGKVYRMGYLGTTPSTPLTLPLWEAFQEGLREGGYVEGQNLLIERRYSEGKPERFPDFASEFVRLQVDVIVVTSTPEKEIANIRERKAQEAGARGTLSQMSRYTVEPLARNKEQCDQYRGYWTSGECRISQALNPGPAQPNEGQLRGGGSLR